jgi:hypothetical protein
VNKAENLSHCVKKANRTYGCELQRKTNFPLSHFTLVLCGFLCLSFYVATFVYAVDFRLVSCQRLCSRILGVAGGETGFQKGTSDCLASVSRNWNGKYCYLSPTIIHTLQTSIIDIFGMLTIFSWNLKILG